MRHDDEYQTEGGGSGGSLIAHLPAIVWQRRWFLIVPLVLLTILSAVAAVLMPVRYTSTATLLVQSSSLPQEIAAGNPDAAIARRLVRIREQLLSRPELIGLVNRYQLYPRQRADAALSTIVATMRRSVAIDPVDAGAQQGNDATIAFTLAYSYSDPLKAQQVAQDLSDQLLQIDATQTGQQADATVQFLTDQAHTLQQRVAEQENRLVALKAANGRVLSSAGVTMLGGSSSGYDVQIAALQRENAQLLSQRNVARTADTRDPAVAQAEAQLAAVQAVYSDNHPDVRVARQRLAEAKALAHRNASNIPVQAADDQIQFNNRQIAALRAAQAGDTARLNATAGAQARAPLVMQQVAQLQQTLDELNEQYKGVSNRLFQAQAGVKAKNEQLGERLSVIDPPAVPAAPNPPYRWMIAAGGPVAGFAVGLILVLLIELFLRPVRDPDTLTRLIGESPLGVIPTVRARSDKPARRFGFRRKAQQ